MKKFLSLSLLMLTAFVGNSRADYSLDDFVRVRLASVSADDLVVIEAASTTKNYGYYIKETPANTCAWQEGFDQSSVWRTVSTGTTNRYYLQNVVTNRYLSGTQSAVTTVESIDDAVYVQFNTYNQPWTWKDYSNQSLYPRGWDHNSIMMRGNNDWCFGNDVSNQSTGKFPNNGEHHNYEWNIYKYVGTDFTSFDGAIVDNIVYNLSKSNNTATIARTGNEGSIRSSIYLPAQITCLGSTFNVTSISTWAFQGSAATNIEFESPANLTSIGDWCFANCNNVTEVEVPEGVTTLNANRAFGKMSSLEKLTLPATLTKVNDYTFSDDPSLKTLVFKGTTAPTFSGYNMFAETTKMNNITIVVPDGALASYEASNIATVYNYNNNFIKVETITVGSNTRGHLADPAANVLNNFVEQSDYDESDYFTRGTSLLDPTAAADGDIIYIQAASHITNTPYFVKDIGGGKCNWSAGADKNALWKLIATGSTYTKSGKTASTYYLQNAVTGNYWAAPINGGTTTTSIDDAAKIAFYSTANPPEGVGYYDANSGSLSTAAGWSTTSSAIVYDSTKDKYIRNDGHNSFSGGGIHNYQNNLYKASFVGTFDATNNNGAVTVTGTVSHYNISDINDIISDNDYASVDMSSANITSSFTAADVASLQDNNTIVYVPATSTTLSGDNIVVGNTCSNLVLTDGSSFAAPKGFTATNANYARTMNNEWGTICLPYDVESTDAVKYYTITGIENGTLIVSEEATLGAGTPALVYKVSGDGISASGSNVVVSGDISNTSGTVQMIGSYTYDNKITDVNGYYIKNNKFYRCNNSFYCDAFRAYFTYSGSMGSNVFNLVVDDDPTAIGSATDTASGAEVVGIYTADGTKVDSPQKGINIIKLSNGKIQKIVVR